MNGFIKAIGGSRQEDLERNTNDHYPTPPLATYALIEHEREHIEAARLFYPVHEPAAGRGWMAKELSRYFPVTASDLHSYPDPLYDIRTGVDFLATDHYSPVIITNPPYAKDMAQKFVEHSLLRSNYIAVLCRLTWAESRKRYSLFKKHPPTKILFFATRFSCNEEYFLSEKAESGMVAYAWWIWDKNRSTSTFDWVAPGCYDRWRKSIA